MTYDNRLGDHRIKLGLTLIRAEGEQPAHLRIETFFHHLGEDDLRPIFEEHYRSMQKMSGASEERIASMLERYGDGKYKWEGVQTTWSGFVMGVTLGSPKEYVNLIDPEEVAKLSHDVGNCAARLRSQAPGSDGDEHTFALYDIVRVRDNYTEAWVWGQEFRILRLDYPHPGAPIVGEPLVPETAEALKRRNHSPKGNMFFAGHELEFIRAGSANEREES